MTKQTRILMLILIPLSMVFVGTASANVIGAVDTQPTEIDSCTVIDSPGEYLLTTDIVTGTAGPCIEITTDNVTLQGQSHKIRGREDTPLQQANDGIYVAGSSTTPLSNITIRDVTTVGWSNGTRFVNVEDSTLNSVEIQAADMNGLILDQSYGNRMMNITLLNNNEEGVANLPGAGRGITLTGNSENNSVSNIGLVNNKYSILFQGSSHGNYVENVSSRDGTYVVYLYSTFDNVFRNISSVGNDRWVLYSERNASDNLIANLTMDSTTVSLFPEDIAIRPVPGPGREAPPVLPDGEQGLGKYAEIAPTRVDKPGSVSLSMTYPAGDATGMNESSISLWQNTNGTWEQTNGSEQNTSENVVFANNLTFPPYSESNSSAFFAPLIAGDSNDLGLRNTTRAASVSEKSQGTATPTITIVDAETQRGAPTRTVQTATTAGGSTIMTPTSSESRMDSETSSSTGPGFGFVTIVVSLLLLLLLRLRAA